MFVIHAPAGFGKSTLLSQFAELEKREVAWLSLDMHDDDAAVLLYDLAHALGAEGPADQDLLGRLRTGAAGVVPLALPRLIALLHERTEPLVIVLDDVHLLRSAAALDVLHSLCANTPPGCTLVLSGRRRPRVRLALLRAAGRLNEVTAAELRMTPGEGAAALRAAGVDVSDREAATVVKRTEGWPAAIYLAGLMVRADDRPGEAVHLGPVAADLAEYVRDEVLADAAREDVDFLVRSSILDELRPEVCNDVLERKDSGERLRALADADLFVTPSDGTRGRLPRARPLPRHPAGRAARQPSRA